MRAELLLGIAGSLAYLAPGIGRKDGRSDSSQPKHVALDLPGRPLISEAHGRQTAGK